MTSEYALVLNAGSSSLKFCVYQRPEGNSWALAARGLMRGNRDSAAAVGER